MNLEDPYQMTKYLDQCWLDGHKLSVPHLVDKIMGYLDLPKLPVNLIIAGDAGEMERGSMFGWGRWQSTVEEYLYFSLTLSSREMTYLKKGYQEDQTKGEQTLFQWYYGQLEEQYCRGVTL